MRSAQHHRDAAGAEVAGKLVAARRAAGDDRDADQVGVEVERRVADALVVEREFGVELGRRQRRQGGERERLVAQRLLEDAAAVSVERAFRREEGDLYGPFAPISAA
jgi:hypothetical protein